MYNNPSPVHVSEFDTGVALSKNISKKLTQRHGEETCSVPEHLIENLSIASANAASSSFPSSVTDFNSEKGNEPLAKKPKTDEATTDGSTPAEAPADDPDDKFEQKEAEDKVNGKVSPTLQKSRA